MEISLLPNGFHISVRNFYKILGFSRSRTTVAIKAYDN